MTNYFNKIKLLVLAHKIISGVVIIVVLLGGYYTYKKFTSTAGETRYITGRVEKGTIVTSVSGTGQVSASNQIDLKPKASGDVVYIGAKNGDKVAAGKLLVEVDPKDAQKSVRDAETNLASAKLAFEKFKIENSEENLTADSLKAYTDGFGAVSDAFLDLPKLTTDLEDILEESSLSSNSAGIVSKVARDYRDKAESSYFIANTSFKDTRKLYTSLNINSPKSDIENVIGKTYKTTQDLTEAIKNMATFVDYMAEHSNSNSAFISEQNILTTDAGTVSGHLSALLNSQTDIENIKDSSQNTNLDFQSEELSLKQKETALQDAKDKLADYFVRAPYAGIVANLDIKKADTISGSTVVATLLTEKQLAEISMNEVDVAKIKVGQKARLTFDAVPDLTIEGMVEEIDSIGTVSQGVVTYDVKITLETQDARVKPAMSVSADIVTDMKEGVLVVPNGAIKTQGNRSYVEAFEAALPRPTDGMIGALSPVAPKRIPVEVGLSNDSQTEIVSGLNEGDEIVIRTITGTTTAATAAPSIFGGAPRTGATGTGGANRTFRAN